MSGAGHSGKLIAFALGLDDPACRFRIRQYIPHLQRAGWDVSLRTNHPERPWASPYSNPLLRFVHQRAGVMWRRVRRRWDIQAASGYDAVLLNRDLLEGRFEYERLLLSRNPRVVFDFDDAIFLGEKSRHIQQICENAAWVTAGNEYLASFARKFTDRVTVLPTVVEPGAYLMHAHRKASGRVRVGWLGSGGSIRETLFPYVPMLAGLQTELGFDFIIVSGPKPDVPNCGLRFQFHQWSPRTEERIAELFDIGIMPLVDDEFQRGKCGCKLLQYMAARLPSVASPVGINRTLIDRGHCGLLAGSAPEWRQALSVLISDAEKRRDMGTAGRAFVEREFSVERWFPSLLDILEKVRNLERRPR